MAYLSSLHFVLQPSRTCRIGPPSVPRPHVLGVMMGYAIEGYGGLERSNT